MDARDDDAGRTPRRDPVPGSALDGEPRWVGEEPVTVRTSLTLGETASVQNIGAMRRGFAAWLALDVAPGDLADDLVLVVYEALANAADHAYADAPDDVGPVRLTAHRAREFLRITVSDDGRWRAATDAPHRGRGLSLIRLLIAQVHIGTNGSGTVVHLRCSLPVPVPPV